MTLHITPYTAADKSRWDNFVANSKNGTFLFHRDYMDYHADRFTDASLMVWEGETLTALLPQNVRIDGDKKSWISHGGLTYGGFITCQRMTTPRMLETFEATLTYARAQNISTWVYKVVPHMYHRLPAEEDLYALFRLGATPYRTDVSSTIPLRSPLALSKGRKYTVTLAKKANLECRESTDWPAFYAILEGTLAARHGAKPTHSLAELELLASRFPENIKLFGTFAPTGEMLAGAVVYDCGQTIHTQYMACGLEGREIGALDLCITHLFREVYADRTFFDFGISTTEGGKMLNEGLIAQKEMFGARATVHQFYELKL